MHTYRNLISIKKDFDNIEGKNLLLFKQFPSGYLLMDEMRVGAYSAWMADEADTIENEKIWEYYKYHPNKTPHYIYIDALSSSNWSEKEWVQYAQNKGYKYRQFDDGAWLLFQEPLI